MLTTIVIEAIDKYQDILTVAGLRYTGVMMEIVSAQAMQDLGERLGAALHGGDVIELVGDVGAGKTTFVRGLAKGLGIEETVQSPSFTISRVYDAARDLRLAHYDFYRLDDAGIMADELAESIADNRTVVVIEWAGAVAGVLPRDRLTLTIASPSEDTRTVVASASDAMRHRLGGIVS